MNFGCPYCNYWFDYPESELNWDGDENTDCKCKYCGRDFCIVADVTVKHSVQGKAKYTKNFDSKTEDPNYLIDYYDYDDWEKELSDKED